MTLSKNNNVQTQKNPNNPKSDDVERGRERLIDNLAFLIVRQYRRRNQTQGNSNHGSRVSSAGADCGPKWLCGGDVAAG